MSGRKFWTLRVFRFNFFFENRAVYEIWEKYDRARQVTDDNIIRRMRFACWINKSTDAHSEYVMIIAFQGKIVKANAHQCDVTRTLPVFCTVILFRILVMIY